MLEEHVSPNNRMKINVQENNKSDFAKQRKSNTSDILYNSLIM